MAEARGRFEWERTSALMALVANLARDPRRTPPVDPKQFNPYETTSRTKMRVPLTALKEVFVREEGKGNVGSR